MSAPRSSGPARILRSSALFGLIIGSITLGSGLTNAPSAAAHDELLSTSPLDGEVLSSAPQSVDLVFSSDIMDVGTAVVVVDASSADRTAGEPELAGTTLTQPLGSLSDGSYQVRWRVVSTDGHPITGAFDFTVGDPASAAAVAPPTSARAPEASDGDAQQVPAAPGGPSSDAPSGGSPWSSAPLWQIAVAGGLLGLGSYALVLRLRRGRPER